MSEAKLSMLCPRRASPIALRLNYQSAVIMAYKTQFQLSSTYSIINRRLTILGHNSKSSDSRLLVARSLNAPIMVSLDNETDPLEVRTKILNQRKLRKP